MTLRMSADEAHHRRRRHDLLLISRLFDLRQQASPFTLILDTLEQSGRGLVDVFVERANVSCVSYHATAIDVSEQRL